MVRGLPLLNPHFNLGLLDSKNFMGIIIMQNLRQRSALSDKMQQINIIERAEKYRIQFYTRVGYVGLVFVQLSIIPNLIFGIAWAMHSSLLIGLCLYQTRNYNIENIRLYSIGNFCGITLNILMLIKIGTGS